MVYTPTVSSPASRLDESHNHTTHQAQEVAAAS